MILRFCNIWNVFFLSSCPITFPIDNLPFYAFLLKWWLPMFQKKKKKNRFGANKISRYDILTRKQPYQLYTINHDSSCSLTVWNTKPSSFPWRVLPPPRLANSIHHTSGLHLSHSVTEYKYLVTRKFKESFFIAKKKKT